MPLVATAALTITDVNDGLNARLTQGSYVVSTDTDGSGGDYSNAVTTLSVLMGGVDTTSSWVISATSSGGVSGSLVGSTYSVTNLLGDAGYVDLTATRAGYSPVVSRFSISKAKRGQAGGTLKLIASAPGFTFRNDVPDPISQTIAITAVRTNTTDPVFFFASNGMTVRTDADEWALRNYVVGLPGMGDGDTCYIDLAEFGDADELFITATCGDLTDVYNIQRVALATSGARGTVQVAAAIPGSVWTDAEAVEAILIAYNVTPRSGDVVTLYNSTAGFSQTRVLNSSGVWHQLAAFFGGDVLVNGTVSGTKLAASNVITLTAQIGDALITDAKIADLSAAKLIAGTTMSGEILVNGNYRIDNPAAGVNAGSVKINPGQILVSGATTLSDWRNPGDLTTINGNQLGTGTVRAEAAVFGQRGIQVDDFEFDYNSPSTNNVSWTAGTIRYIGDDGNIVTRSVAAGSAAWTSNTVFICYQKNATVLTATTNAATAFGDDYVILAAYKGDNHLVTDYGRTIIDGGRLKTGTVIADQARLNSIDSDAIQAGAVKAVHLEATSVTADKLAAGAVTAEKLDVTDLSAISADLGTVTAGLLQSPDGKFIIDLTNGFIEILN
ncbi:MAG: hypothetical protein EOR25_10795 [Mesorhizobium sp.]|uniref:hypothetical protein n=1 Tax=Mesorhizobium sp. TaxID=1871066 RepID=UPI000FE33948|nr:hypothetical protein [Mesorhizobium sp.]RWH49604.1 MAG: hypothetical protein EOQ80_06765 [Mesorhizobium sp.]RWH52159.1 MAG: hypothetical protein EOQ82_27145 [Mesorhizobium sp.]RWI48410.1 MAG: hypothetical protein EOR15_13690 [Mesorhizobium sp.]RWI64059.1 MAG: hypothetical protein EOR18_30360 [Mesorhizobium sp.]RWI88161.1 MAG: hypothetical protein EOR20_03745 [Mesorhizobium sp.]